MKNRSKILLHQKCKKPKKAKQTLPPPAVFADEEMIAQGTDATQIFLNQNTTIICFCLLQIIMEVSLLIQQCSLEIPWVQLKFRQKPNN